MPEEYLRHFVAGTFFLLSFGIMQILALWLGRKEKNKSYSTYLIAAFAIAIIVPWVMRALVDVWRPDLSGAARTGNLLGIFGIVLWWLLAVVFRKKKA